MRPIRIAVAVFCIGLLVIGLGTASPQESAIPKQLSTLQTPREILAADFKSLGELPISGGWGYTRDDAVIIDANDPVVPKGVPFHGVDLEYIFVKYRIYEEMMIRRSRGQKFLGIEWKRLGQFLVSNGKDNYDHLRFEIWAFLEADWKMLKNEWDERSGNTQFDLQEHNRKREQKTVRFTRDFWFNITSFLPVDEPHEPRSSDPETDGRR